MVAAAALALLPGGKPRIDKPRIDEPIAPR
jgi:hypothetical protein